jgi:hypothetical protein
LDGDALPLATAGELKSIVELFEQQRRAGEFFKRQARVVLREEVEAFLEAVAESELKSHIKGTQNLPIPPLTGVRGFEILR